MTKGLATFLLVATSECLFRLTCSNESVHWAPQRCQRRDALGHDRMGSVNGNAHVTAKTSRKARNQCPPLRASPMAGTSTDYTLMKLDKIEDMIREVRQILQDRPSQPPSTVGHLVSTRLERWLLSLKPLYMALSAAGRQAISVAVIVYMAKGGSLGPAEPYVRYLLG